MHHAPHTAATIANALRHAGIDVELRGEGGVVVQGVAPAERAGEGAITFFRNEKFVDSWRNGAASVAIISKKHADAYSLPASGRTLLLAPDADLAFIAVLHLFAPPAPARPPGIHPSAVVDLGAEVHPTAHVGPHCVIENGATIHAGAILVAGAHVGAHATIGEHSFLHPQVRVLDRCVVGKRCLLHPGATLGADGFGFKPDGKGGLAKVPQIGNVIIHDDVEVGANTCIDRATVGSTVVGSGTKLDNHVQIGHNCILGKCCILCGHAALSGSVTLGDGVVLGGSVGIADGLTIGSGAQVAAQGGVMNDIPPGEIWIGAPAGPASEMRRNIAAYRRLAETLSEIKKKLR